jgi:phage FluMu gp28-like protein
VSLTAARAQGFAVEVESLRAAIADEDAWQQEYCCRFLTDAAHYFPPELVAAAESSDATLAFPWTATRAAAGGVRDPLFEQQIPRPDSIGTRNDEPGPMYFGGPRRAGVNPAPTGAPMETGACYLGVDVGRKRDLTVLWLIEIENPEAAAEARVFVTRGVVTLERRPFAEQRKVLEALLGLRGEIRNSKIENRGAETSFEFRDTSFVIHRCAIDATGMGALLAEELHAKWGARVEPVTFTAAVKEDLAVRAKRLLEEGRLKIPYDPAIRAAFNSVKRVVTAAGNVRFDADRTDAAGHADHFWALALALAAADSPAPSVEFVSSGAARAFAITRGF